MKLHILQEFVLCKGNLLPTHLPNQYPIAKLYYIPLNAGRGFFWQDVQVLFIQLLIKLIL